MPVSVRAAAASKESGTRAHDVPRCFWCFLCPVVTEKFIRVQKSDQGIIWHKCHKHTTILVVLTHWDLVSGTYSTIPVRRMAPTARRTLKMSSHKRNFRRRDLSRELWSISWLQDGFSRLRRYLSNQVGGDPSSGVHIVGQSCLQRGVYGRIDCSWTLVNEGNRR